MKQWMVLVFALMLTASGCATMGDNAVRQVDDAVEDWTEAMMAKDIDAIMTYYSDHFTDYDYENKAALTAFMAESKDMGYLDDLKIDRSGATIEADGDVVKVGPIGISGYFGVITVHLQFVEESGEWLIIGQDVYGL